MIFDIDGAEEKIGYEFKDKMLLRKCFTHSSFANENGEEDNELLEFFGDAIIEFIVTEYLVKNVYGDEGDLTEKRKELVSKEPLYKIVKKKKLDGFMLLGNGQVKSKNTDEKLYSSLFEAIVAGIYLDGGISKAKKFIEDTLIKDYLSKEKRKKKTPSEEKDFKSLLQEYVQKGKMGSVSYEKLSKKGPAHMPEFRVAVLLNNSVLAEGKGKSVKAAEKTAAGKALKKLKAKGTVDSSEF